MKTKRRLLITGIIVGSLFTLSPLFGFLGTVIGMMRAFSVLEKPGIHDPNALASSISTTLFSTAAGFFLFPIGVVVFVLCLVYFLRLPASNPPSLPTPSTE